MHPLLERRRPHLLPLQQPQLRDDLFIRLGECVIQGVEFTQLLLHLMLEEASTGEMQLFDLLLHLVLVLGLLESLDFGVNVDLLEGDLLTLLDGLSLRGQPLGQLGAHALQ